MGAIGQLDKFKKCNYERPDAMGLMPYSILETVRRR